MPEKQQLIVVLNISGRPAVAVVYDTSFTYLHSWEETELMDKYAEQYAIKREDVTIGAVVPLIKVDGLVK